MENRSKVFSVDDLRKQLRQFEVFDYAVFSAMLLLSSLVGLYFGYKNYVKKRNFKKSIQKPSADAVNNYLMGGRKLKVIPVAMSLVASFASGITLLGTSTEIYLYGTQYMLTLFALLIISILINFTFLPIFHELGLTTTYEYLQLRFDYRMRFYGSTMFSISMIFWLPIVIYVPALAFNQMTGIDIHLITFITMALCIFYTMLGGIKAVVWTDVLQLSMMYCLMIFIAVKGTLHVGSFFTIIERNLLSERLEEIDFRIDPTIRHSFWTLLIGGSFFWLSETGLDQPIVQRYLAIKDVQGARKCSILFTIGLTLLILLASYNGLLLYATYHDCDPLTTKLATAKDQMMPLFIMDMFKNHPGLPGLFIAGIFAAALSSLSTALNSMSAIILEDFVKPFAKLQISESKSLLIMRLSVFAIGILTLALVYIVEHMGTILQLTISMTTFLKGPLTGVFLIGIFLPWIGGKSTFYAAISSCISISFLVLKAQIGITFGRIRYETKPVSIDGCTYNFTQIDVPIFNSDDNEKNIFNISYLYFGALGAVMTIVLAFLYSLIFGFQDPSSVDPKLLAPFIRKYFILKYKPTEQKEWDEKEITIHKFNIKNENHSLVLDDLEFSQNKNLKSIT